MSLLTLPSVRHWISLGVLIVALFGASVGTMRGRVCVAATGQGSQTAAAQHLMQEGSRALASGNLPLALQKLEQAYLKAPLPEVLYLLGKTAQLQQRDLAAVDLYRRYLAAVEDSVPSPINAEIQRFVATVPKSYTELEVVSVDVGAVLRVDGRVVGSLPLAAPLILAAGMHRFELAKNQHKFETNVLQIPSDQRVQLQLALASRYAVLTVATAVALLIVPPTVTPDVKAQLTQQITPAVQQAHAYLIPGTQTEAALQRTSAPAECEQSVDCLEQLARQLEASQVLSLTILPSVDTPKLVRVRLFDAEIGATAGAAEDSCDSCVADSIKDRIPKLAQQVLKAAWNRGRGSVQITSEPPGAVVMLGGRVMGKTPFARDAFDGPLDLELSLDGFLRSRHKIEVAHGRQTALAVVLQKPAPPIASAAVNAPVAFDKPLTPRRPIWRWVTGGVITGAGIILAGFGFSALAANGTCVVDPATPGAVCGTVRNTGTPTGALLGTGGALTTVGVVLLALPPK